METSSTSYLRGLTTTGGCYSNRQDVTLLHNMLFLTPPCSDHFQTSLWGWSWGHSSAKQCDPRLNLGCDDDNCCKLHIFDYINLFSFKLNHWLFFSFSFRSHFVKLDFCAKARFKLKNFFLFLNISTLWSGSHFLFLCHCYPTYQAGANYMILFLFD